MGVLVGVQGSLGIRVWCRNKDQGLAPCRAESQSLWERVLVLRCAAALAAAILYGLLLALRKPRGVSNSSERVLLNQESKNRQSLCLLLGSALCGILDLGRLVRRLLEVGGEEDKAGAMSERLTRIAIVTSDRCKPKKCRQECKKSCPVVKTGPCQPSPHSSTTPLSSSFFAILFFILSQFSTPLGS